MAAQKKKNAKTPAKPLDPVEQTVLSKPQGNYKPQTVRRSVVTMEQVTDILQDLPTITTPVEEAITRGKKKSVTKVSLSDDFLESGMTAPLGQFQRAVLEAALSQLMAGNNTWSSSMLYRTMTGRSNSEPVSAEQQKMVDDAMTQLMYTPLHIDLELHMPDGVLAEGDSAVLDGPIIPAERLTMEISGTACTAYKLLSTPIIYRFCAATKSLTMTPIDLLSVDMNYTRRNLALLNSLQRRIAPLIYPVSGEYKQPSPITIPYDSLYEVALDEGVGSLSSVMKKRVRATVQTILDTWKRGGYISKWENIQDGHQYVACKLFFPKKSPPKVPPANLLEESN